MDLLEFVINIYPGEVIEDGDSIIIKHYDDQVSQFFKAKNKNYHIDLPKSIKNIYEQYDGIDLFSSTFKFCTINNPSVHENVNLFTSIDDLAYQMEDIEFPEPSVSFLNESGNWIYSASKISDKIYSFDVDLGEIEVFSSVSEVIENWVIAVKEE